MEAIKKYTNKVKEGVVSVYESIRERYRRHRKKCRAFWIILGLITLLTGLIMGSFKWVGSLDQGVPINYTSGTILDKVTTNFGSFIGLNTYYKTIPNTNFLLSFNSKPTQTDNEFDSIIARVAQGTKLQIQVYAQVRIQSSNLKLFFENYGIDKVHENHQGWQLYIKEKIRNVVVQEVARFKFYEISNKKLATAINQVLQTYETTASLNYPFTIRIIAINIHYPQQTIQANDTLGIKLLQKKTLLSQLRSQLNNLDNYVQQYQASAQNYAIKNGVVEGRIASGERAVRLDSKDWSRGVKVLWDGMLGNATLTQKYLQTYFNQVYNATYRIQSLQPFQI